MLRRSSCHEPPYTRPNASSSSFYPDRPVASLILVTAPENSTPSMELACGGTGSLLALEYVHAVQFKCSYLDKDLIFAKDLCRNFIDEQGTCGPFGALDTWRWFYVSQ